jgi:DNA integrity scanning protein DisA with diadenylate cyclase activity
MQFQESREYHKIEKKIFSLLRDIADESYKEGSRKGLLIVLGAFDAVPDAVVYGMRQIGDSPIKKYLDVSGKFTTDVDKLLKENHDGAIIVNKDGQILGAKIYLTVENPTLEVPDGTGTRHITAASFSLRDDVIAVFTLSEETGAARVWKNSQYTEQYLPGQEESADET